MPLLATKQRCASCCSVRPGWRSRLTSSSCSGSFYSERDGVVAWQACIDRWSPQVRHVEVRETHLGLGVAPRVLAVMADALQAHCMVPRADRSIATPHQIADE